MLFSTCHNLISYFGRSRSLLAVMSFSEQFRFPMPPRRIVSRRDKSPVNSVDNPLKTPPYSEESEDDQQSAPIQQGNSNLHVRWAYVCHLLYNNEMIIKD